MPDSAAPTPEPSPEAPVTGTVASSTEPEPLMPPRRRRSTARRVLIAVIVVGVVLVLLLIAAVVAEGLARSRAAGEVEDRMRTALGLSADAEIDTRIAADRPLLLQLAGGALDRVDVDVPRYGAQGLVGDLALTAEGVPLSETGSITRLDLEYRVAEADLDAIAGSLTGLDTDSVTLEAPEIRVGTSLTVLGLEIPLVVGLEPGVDDGALTFDPTTLRFGADEISVADLRANPLFSGLASAVLQQQEVCVASGLPAALTVREARVDGDELVITADGDDVVLADLGTPGSCPSIAR
ncbi:MAG: DUF2993 domain-containing protein [Actinomycetales bacterium]|nr:DUF2993 domain-containing protein [Actinomycetales bacterium]